MATSAVDKQIITNESDREKLEQATADYNAAKASGNTAGTEAAHAAAQAVRAKYGYQGGNDGTGYYPIGNQAPAVKATSLSESMEGYIRDASSAYLPDSTQRKADMKAILDEQKAAQEEQLNKQVDYAVEKGTKELQRAEEDAQAGFQTQRDQIDLDEQKAKDNAALYAKARGDNGGIGAAQYDAISAAAMKNRQTVASAQQKLSTDTARQISDLRAQGEFEKADKLLSITQNYLSQLMNLEQWAASYDLSVAQFNESVREWAAEFEAQCEQFDIQTEFNVAELTGYYRGQPTLQLQQIQNSQNASAAEALLSAGIMPTDAQLKAIGWTKNQASLYLSALSAAGKSVVGNPSPAAAEPYFAEPTKFPLTSSQALSNFNAGDYSAAVIATLIDTKTKTKQELLNAGVTEAEYTAGEVAANEFKYGSNYYAAKSVVQSGSGKSKQELFAYLQNNAYDLTEDGYEKLLGDPKNW